MKLERWAADGVTVGVIYARSAGRLTALLRGRLRFADGLLRIAGQAGLLTTQLAGARFEIGPVSWVSRDFDLDFSLEGLHAYTAEGDWLFIAPGLVPSIGPPKLESG
jgi:hypothetical protein